MLAADTLLNLLWNVGTLTVAFAARLAFRRGHRIAGLALFAGVGASGLWLVFDVATHLSDGLKLLSRGDVAAVSARRVADLARAVGLGSGYALFVSLAGWPKSRWAPAWVGATLGCFTAGAVFGELQSRGPSLAALGPLSMALLLGGAWAWRFGPKPRQGPLIQVWVVGGLTIGGWLQFQHKRGLGPVDVDGDLALWTGPSNPTSRPAGGCFVLPEGAGWHATTRGAILPAFGMRPCPGGNGPTSLGFLSVERPQLAVPGAAPLSQLAATPWLTGSGSVDLLVRHGLRVVPVRQWATVSLPLLYQRAPNGEGGWRLDSDIPDQLVLLLSGTPSAPMLAKPDGSAPTAFTAWTDAARRTVLAPPLSGWTVQDFVDLCAHGAEGRFGCGVTDKPWAPLTAKDLPGSAP